MKAHKKTIFGFLFVTCLIMLPISPARAQCSNPAGVEGQIIHNDTYNTPQYCDNTNWVAMVGADPTLNAEYEANAVNFDGTNDYLTHTSALTGATDGKQITISFWARFETYPSLTYQVLGSQPNRVSISYAGNGTETMQLILRDTANVMNTNIGCGPDPHVAGVWYHHLISVDTATGAANCYVDDVDSLQTFTAPTDATLDFDMTTWGIGATHAGNSKLNGQIADLWIDFNTYIDFSVEANRRRFIDASGKPVNLGADGSTPTGSAPEIFMSGDTSNWHTNKGTGGGFTENGEITDSATLPYNATQTTQIVPSGLEGHWRLDETSGSIAYDSSGNGTHMNYNGSIDTSLHSVNGKVGNGIDVYSGGTYRGDISTNSAPLSIKASSQITIAAWVKVAADLSNVEGVVRLPGLLEWNIKFNDNRFLFDTKGWDTDRTAWGPNFKLNTWTHIAVSYDYNLPPNTAPVWYINGVQQSSYGWVTSTPTGSFTPTTNQNLYIATDTYPGAIDDVRIYNRILTEDEVYQIFDAKDGIRYNESHRTPEYFDGNKFVSLRTDFPEVDKGHIFGYQDAATMGCSTIGDTCSDGTFYAGLSPDGSEELFIAPVDEGIYHWGPQGTFQGFNNYDDGDGNTAALAALAAVHSAARACENKTTNGYLDWYLPARNETVNIYNGGSPIGGVIADGTEYWTSTEYDANSANSKRYNTGAVINRGKSPLRIRCVRKGPAPILNGSGGLVAHWKLDETEGTIAYDSSGNGNDGTMNDLELPDQVINAPLGKGIKFTLPPTTSDVERITAATGFPTGTDQPFTISMWTNIINYWDGAFFFVGSSGANQEIYIRTDGNGNWLRFYYGGTSFNDSNYFSGYFDEWLLMTIVFDGTDLVFYRNGTEVNRQTTGTLTITQPAFGIGHAYAGGSYSQVQGSVDDFRLYNRALTTTEINKLYQMGIPRGSSTALPQGCPNIGDMCDDGTIYTGLSPDGSVEMYGSPLSLETQLSWNNGNSANFVLTSISGVSGETNTNSVVVIDSDSGTAGFQPHQAAQYCYDLSYAGADDWYLPSRNEYDVALPALFTAGQTLPPVSLPRDYHSSEEQSQTGSVKRRLEADGTVTTGSNYPKQASTGAVRCVRKGPAPRCANPYGLEGQMIYNTTHSIVQYCDGARWIGLGKDN